MAKSKKTLALIICLVMCVSILTSCGENKSVAPVFENGKLRLVRKAQTNKELVKELVASAL